jgi:hypothetical protein
VPSIVGDARTEGILDAAMRCNVAAIFLIVGESLAAKVLFLDEGKSPCSSLFSINSPLLFADEGPTLSR